MKKVIFLLIISLYSLICKVQHIKLSDNVSVDMPDGAEALNRDQFSAYINNKFSHSKTAQYPASPVERHANKHFFKVNNVSVILIHGKRPSAYDNYLAKQKNYFDGLYNSNKEQVKYNSEILPVNNNQVLIIYYVMENVGYYSFFCNDPTNTKALNGVLQFDEGDKDEAKSIMDKILNSVEFR